MADYLACSNPLSNYKPWLMDFCGQLGLIILPLGNLSFRAIMSDTWFGKIWNGIEPAL
jgi:hypothetical protein